MVAHVTHVVIAEAMTDALAVQLAHLMWGETKVLNVLRIKVHYKFLTFSYLFFIAILSTFSIKQETVIGPTPPGTGVI